MTYDSTEDTKKHILTVESLINIIINHLITREKYHDESKLSPPEKDIYPPPVEYDPPQDGQLVARYADGVELIFRETGWIPLGSCPVRFEGEAGWIETGDSGKYELSSPELLAGRTVEEIGGYPATFHVRDFLDCVKTRSQPKGNVPSRRAMRTSRATRRTSRSTSAARSNTTSTRTSSSTTSRRIGCARRHCVNRGGYKPHARYVRDL